MSRAIPQFEPHAVCRKCGSISVGSKFCLGNRADLCYVGDIGGQRGLNHGDREAIHRHCQVCHFEWLERPLDQQAEIRSE